MGQVRHGLELMLQSHMPYPAIIIDRHSNPRFQSRRNDARDHARRRPVSGSYRPTERHASRVPSRRSQTGHCQLGGAGTVTGGPCAARPTPPPRTNNSQPSPRTSPAPSTASPIDGDDGDLLIPVHYRRGDLELRLFSTIARIGSPLDITLAELSLELFFPADTASDQQLRALTGG